MAKKAPSLDQEKAALYALPLEGFIAARNALAARLKREGRSKDVAPIKALRKPSASAWLVNALIRDKGPEVRALLTAGERVRKVQRKAMRGGGDSGGDLRAALKTEQAALAQVRRALVKLAGARGGSAVVDRALTTMRSVAQGAKAPGFDKGQLTEDVAPLGFESLAWGLRGRALPSMPARAPRAAVKAEPPATAAKTDLPRAPGKRARPSPVMKSPPPSGVRMATKSTRRAAQAEARARRIEATEAALREAEAELRALEARAQKAEEEQAKAADAAKQAVDTAKQAADTAKRAADTARRTAAEAKQAAAGAKQAEQQATSARRALREAEARHQTAERAHRKASSKR